MYNIIWYDGYNFNTNEVLQADVITKDGKPVNNKSRKLYLNLGAGFDCETSQYANHLDYEKGTEQYNNALKSFVYIWQFSVGHDIYLCRDYNLFDKFLHDLDNAVTMKRMQLSKCVKELTLIVWDANIKYEYSYFKHIFNHYITKIFAKSKTDIVTFDCMMNLQFRECLGAFGQSLENVAKNYTTTQKLVGDIDYNLIRTPETPLTGKEIEYCVNDVAILSELTAVAFEMYTSKGDTIPLTQTGIVRNAIKKKLVPDYKAVCKAYAQNKPLIGTKEQYNTYRQYVYSGGLTHSNFYYVGQLIEIKDGHLFINNVDKGDAEHAIKCYDLTSAYPWALNTCYYPAGEMIKCENVTEFKKAFTYRHWFMKVTLYNVESKSTHSTLSIHKVLNHKNTCVDNGRIWKCSELTAYFTEVDWNNFKMIYNFDSTKSLIHEVVYFTKSVRVPDAMLDVMNNWYKKKTIIKQAGTHNGKDKKLYKLLKQLINSVYGMTVTSLYEQSMEWNSEHSEIDVSLRDWDKTSNTIFNPWFGYYCTSYVRFRLIEMISKFPEYIVQYDTDSIYCLPSKELDNAVKAVNDRTFKRCTETIKYSECWDLGQWDSHPTEDRYSKFIPLGSKRYIGTNFDGDLHITFAGANEKDLIKHADNNNLSIYEYCKDIDISEKESNKKGAYHYDGEYTGTVTDYLGNTATVTTYGCTTIKTVAFKASLSHTFSLLRKEYLS